MKRIVFLMVVTLTNLCNSQQLFMEIGKTMSAFDYKNSLGVRLDNMQSKPNNYLKMGYRDVLNHNETLFFSIGANYNGYGAIGSDRLLDNFYEWDVTYLGVEAGVDFRIFRIRDFSFFLKGTASAEFLIQGNQTLNNQVFNLVGEEEFNNHIFFLRGGLMMTYPISRNTHITANYSLGKTVLLDKGNATDQEELKLLAHQFGFGIIISLPNCNCPF
ncbi:hypothetical protein [Psychroserpens sp. SPM9]|uniref:hypothetical protein n=1 Tax=Psychroserpens sp. SPM9 TaxID=2975598 RepID=UPI0021A74368|nr:hypothetical protein [Psychroserpens sp. SPM9]MDG5492027.1 hypothetical protein [Psychroserpens sp. SPM9]